MQRIEALPPFTDAERAAWAAAEQVRREAAEVDALMAPMLAVEADLFAGPLADLCAEAADLDALMAADRAAEAALLDQPRQRRRRA